MHFIPHFTTRRLASYFDGEITTRRRFPSAAAIRHADISMRGVIASVSPLLLSGRDFVAAVALRRARNSLAWQRISPQ